MNARIEHVECAPIVESCPTCGAVTDIEYGDVSQTVNATGSGNVPANEHISQAGKMVIPLADQLAIFGKYARDGFDLMLQRLADCRDLIIALEVDRMEEIGAGDYGDASFHRPVFELYDEMDAELCDAVFYAALICWKGRE